MIHLKNATFIDWKTLSFQKTDIWVASGKNGKIYFSKPESTEEISEIVDCTGKLVTRSFVIGHHHVYSAMARGMAAPKKQPENFQEILKYVWWTLDKCLDKDMIEYSALSTAIACAKAGTTFVIDHHASPFAVEGSLEIIAKAFDQVGISHLLCYEISDRDGREIAEKGLEETESYLQKNQGLVGLHASFTLSDDTLYKAADLMSSLKSGVHIHVAEDISDQEHCLYTYNKRVVNRLASFGMLNSSKTILGHCLHLSSEERKMIAESPCWVVQNMESNLNNAVGYFSGKDLGDNIMIGTDGMHSDMIRSARSAFFVGQKTDQITYPSSYERFRNAHRYLESNGFEGDGENNLVMMDYDSPTEMNSNNFYGHFLFGLGSNHVTDVISSGKLIMKDRKMTLVDEKEILKTSRGIANKLWAKMQG